MKSREREELLSNANENNKKPKYSIFAGVPPVEKKPYSQQHQGLVPVNQVIHPVNTQNNQQIIQPVNRTSKANILTTKTMPTLRDLHTELRRIDVEGGTFSDKHHRLAGLFGCHLRKFGNGFSVSELVEKTPEELILEIGKGDREAGQKLYDHNYNQNSYSPSRELGEKIDAAILIEVIKASYTEPNYVIAGKFGVDSQLLNKRIRELFNNINNITELKNAVLYKRTLSIKNGPIPVDNSQKTIKANEPGQVTLQTKIMPSESKITINPQPLPYKPLSPANLAYPLPSQQPNILNYSPHLMAPPQFFYPPFLYSSQFGMNPYILNFQPYQSNITLSPIYPPTTVPMGPFSPVSNPPSINTLPPIITNQVKYETPNQQEKEATAIASTTTEEKVPAVSSTTTEEKVQPTTTSQNNTLFSPSQGPFLRDTGQVFQNKMVNEPGSKEYDINDKDSVKELEKDCNHSFVYDGSTDQKYLNGIKLVIGNVHAIKQKGVFSKVEIRNNRKSNIMLGLYHGPYLEGEKLENALNDETNEYLYEIRDKNGDIIACIDAREVRNWTAFINHSHTPNLYKETKTINNKKVVVFYLLKDIHEGDQLTHNYGQYFFTSQKSLYLHSSDNWEPYEYRYDKNEKFYLKNLFDVDNKARIDLGIPNDAFLLLPSIFLHIEKGDAAEIADILKNYPKEMLAYFVTKDFDFKEPENQQHITPLMYACYRQKLEWIEALLNVSDVVDRYTFNSGHSPLMLLLLTDTQQNKDKIEKTAMALLDKMVFPFVNDANGFNILHYAIKCNFNSLIEKIMLRADKSAYLPFDVVTPLIESNSSAICNLDFCLKNSQFKTLEILLDYIIPSKDQLGGKFADLIKEDRIFKKETLENLSPKQLEEFEKVISKYPAINNIVKSKLDSSVRKPETRLVSRNVT